MDCILLVRTFYQEELGIDFILPEYSFSKRWILDFRVERFEKEIKGIAKKIPLTSAGNYDLLVFKHKDYIMHFGIFLKPNRMLHIEEGRTSSIDTLSDYWMESLHGVYRHNDLV